MFKDLITLKSTVSHSTKNKSSANRLVLNDHIPISKNQNLLFGVSEFGRGRLTMDGLPYTDTVSTTAFFLIYQERCP